MEVAKQDFIHIQMERLCKICYRKARIINALNNELPDKGFLFEMQEKFHEIVKREG